MHCASTEAFVGEARKVGLRAGKAEAGTEALAVEQSPKTGAIGGA
jgi:hypothetical protein